MRARRLSPSSIAGLGSGQERAAHFSQLLRHEAVLRRELAMAGGVLPVLVRFVAMFSQLVVRLCRSLVRIGRSLHAVCRRQLGFPRVSPGMRGLLRCAERTFGEIIRPGDVKVLHYLIVLRASRNRHHQRMGKADDLSTGWDRLWGLTIAPTPNQGLRPTQAAVVVE